MAEFPGLPENIYQWDSKFSYDAWDAQTTVTLCTVPWDMSYRDIVKFTTDSERDAWFDAQKTVENTVVLNTKYLLKYGLPVTINIPFNTANRYNYIRVESPLLPVPHEQPDARTQYFYFITNMEQGSSNATQVNVQLDVWTTYGNSVTFQQCYIERGHYAMQQTPTVDQWLLSSYNDKALLIPEGMDYGADYIVSSVNHKCLQEFSGDDELMIVISATADVTASNWGTIEKPNLDTSQGGIFDSVPSGAFVFAVDVDDYQDLMIAFSKAPWISQTIQSITAMPKSMIALASGTVSVGGVPCYSIAGVKNNKRRTYRIPIAKDDFGFETRYAELTKLYTYPYSAYVLTDDAGQTLVYRPEGMRASQDSSGRSGYDMEVMTLCTPPFMEYAVYPRNYNNAGTHSGPTWSAGLMSLNDPYQCSYTPSEFMEAALIVSNFPHFSIVNNSYLNYMASNARTRAYQYSAADWANQKAMAANQLGYDQSMSSLQNSLANTDEQINANNQLNTVRNTALVANGLMSGVNSLASGSAAGAGLGIANAAASTVINYSANNANNNISNALAANVAANNYNQGKYVADTNLSYGNYAATGDYAQSIQAINAKVQDAQVLPPSVSGNAGGDALMMANGYYGYTFKIKRIRPEFVRVIGDFWMRYGYYWQGFATPPASLMCCTKFTYWKMQQTYIDAAGIPETYKQTIRGIFEKGVTVWGSPDYIGNTDLADNEVIR